MWQVQGVSCILIGASVFTGASQPGFRTPGPAANGAGHAQPTPAERAASGNGSMEYANPTFGQVKLCQFVT